ncbi:MAG: hypothetical protein CMJ65_11520 [Planctomycetaceae bacterium]|nr:hypothetical protein [Planctomycetaceae bacterium]
MSEPVTIDRLPLLLLIALWVTTLGILVSPEPEAGFSIAHARVPGMEQGDTGLQRHADTLTWSWLFGVTMIAVVGVLMIWGSQSRWTDRLGRLLLAATLVLEVIFTAMCWSYRQQLSDPTATTFFAGFPPGTAWQLYGMGLAPFLFVGLYVFFFRQRIVTEATASGFDRLTDRPG